MKNNILTEKQYGFTQKRSCVPNLLNFYSRVTDITQEREGWVDCVYLDLKKAFDKVPHNMLLWKLENRRNKWKTKKLDGKLLNRKKDENGGKGCKIKMEKSG